MDEENNSEYIVCGENIQNAIKILLSAHSKDIMKVEKEFQTQKKLWNEEKATLVKAYKRLKEKNEILLKIIKDNGIVLNGNDNTKDCNNVNPINGSGSDNETKDNNNTFQSKKKVVNIKKKDLNSTTTATDTVAAATTTANGDNNTNNGKKNKKRKSNEVSLEAKDDLDLPLVNDKHKEEDEQLQLQQFVSISQSQSSPSAANQLLSNRFGDNNKSPTSSTPSSQQSGSTPTSLTSTTKQQKSYKYSEVVRNKAEREQMEGFECQHCKGFYDAVLGENYDKKILLNQCSRHRHDDTPPSTPPGFWDFGFGDSPLKKK